jgi:hypothetical protein
VKLLFTILLLSIAAAAFPQTRGCVTGAKGKVICLGESPDIPEATRLREADERNRRQLEWATQQSNVRVKEDMRRAAIAAQEHAREQAQRDAKAQVEREVQARLKLRKLAGDQAKRHKYGQHQPTQEWLEEWYRAKAELGNQEQKVRSRPTPNIPPVVTPPPPTSTTYFCNGGTCDGTNGGVLYREPGPPATYNCIGNTCTGNNGRTLFCNGGFCN